MEPIKEGLTWRQIQELFAADDDYEMLIGQRLRRIKKWKRKRGEPEDRKVVRVTIQRLESGSTKTVYRKNLRDLGDNYLDTPAEPKVVDRINVVLAELAVA